MFRLSALIVALLVLCGCRETIVGPPTADPGDVPAPSANSMYVKVPPLLVSGDIVEVRGEAVEGGVRFGWMVTGDGDVSLRANDPTGRRRVLVAEALDHGTVTITARAYDASNNVVAMGSRVVEILPY